jgi:XTP/dITP diphosphohydrolase
MGLKDLGLDIDIPETGLTLQENALIKARFLYQQFNIDCFSDDTGLEIEALNGEPGVFSARYAGEEKSSEKNMDKVLNLLQNKSNRNARFVTVVALILDGKEFLFEGIVEGVIRKEKVGKHGFGYDPIFEPENSGLTFAQMTMDEKAQLSHRARALEKMISFLGGK